MANRIYKYTIPVEGCVLEIPKGSQHLSCQLQRNEIVIWAIVNPDQQETTKVQISVYGTNHELPDYLTARYLLATLQLGPLVLHVFHYPA